MDKQDAIDFIVQEFENGRSPSEIAGDLSVQLKAPLEVVTGFVSRTLDQRLAQLGEGPGAPAPAAPRPYMETAATDEPPALERSRASVDASDAPMAAEAPPVTFTPPADILPPLPPHSEAIDPRLEKFILDALGKDRKESDIVMEVCERARIGWPEAQRMVARVHAMQRKQIVARRNRLLAPISLGFIAVGLGLVYAGLSELVRLFPALAAINAGEARAALQNLPPDFSRSAFWALGLGAALILGGAAGVVRMIRAGAA